MTDCDRPVLRSYMSDNAAGTTPEILAALTSAASGLVAPYGADSQSAAVRRRLEEIFECPLEVFPVSTGTAANGLALSAVTAPWRSIVSHSGAHINNDEAGGPEFFTGGAKILCVDGENGKIDPGLLRKVIHDRQGDVHAAKPAVVSITQTTETGSVYSPDELSEISEIAHDAGLRVHMDGARFANAIVALGVTPAEMSWKCGVNILSFGATKNGTLTADAVVSFESTLAEELAHRHKRAGQLSSKMRFQTAQLDAYLTDDLWLRNAMIANETSTRLRKGMEAISGIEIQGDPKSNLFFCRLQPDLLNHLQQSGFKFYGGLREPGVARFVTSFAHKNSDIDALLAAIHQFEAIGKV